MRPNGLELDLDHALADGNRRAADVRLHDLRHSCASYLAMNGATPLEIGDVLGHKTLAMVRRYSHLSAEHKKNLTERVLTGMVE